MQGTLLKCTFKKYSSSIICPPPVAILVSPGFPCSCSCNQSALPQLDNKVLQFLFVQTVTLHTAGIPFTSFHCYSLSEIKSNINTLLLVSPTQPRRRGRLTMNAGCG